MTLGKPRRFDTDYHPVAAEKPCMTTTQAKQTQDDRSSWPTWGGSGAARTQWLLRLMAAATLVIAAALRLWRLDLTIFERDEGAIVRVAEGIVRLGSRPLSGPVFSQGTPSAPHFMYLLAPIVALARDPAFISGAIAVANLAGIAGTLWLGWRAFGPVGGITASLLYAVSPWAVFYARRIWQPDILPPMAVLLFVALDLAVIERRAWWAAVTFPVAVLAVLVHPAFATLLPVLCVPLVLLVIWRRWLPLVLGLGLAACMTVPTLLYGAQTHWVDVANMRYYSSLHTWIDLEAVRCALVAATGLAAPAEVTAPPFDHALPAWLVQAGAGLATILLAGALVLGLFLLVRARGATRLRLIGVLLWMLLPVVLTIRHTLPLHTHYFLIAYPAIFLLLGFAAAWLLRRSGIFARSLVAVCVALLVVLQSVEVTRGLSVAAATYDPCYGRPLNTEQSVEREIVDVASRAGSTRAAVEFATDDALPRGYLARADFAAVDMAGVGSFGLGSPAHVPASTEPTSRVLTSTARADLAYASGVRLLDVAYSERPLHDQRLSLAIDWLVEATATSNHPHVWDISLVNAAGEKVYTKAGIEHVPENLQGQRVISWFTIDPYQEQEQFLPPGAYHIEVRLVDGWTYAAVDAGNGAGGRTDVLSVGPVQLGPPIRCVSS